MCGFMTCEGDRSSISLNNEYLKNIEDASIYYAGLWNQLDSLKYASDNGNNEYGSNYSRPLIFGYNSKEGKTDPQKAMCAAFVEYYKNGKLRTKKINIV